MNDYKSTLNLPKTSFAMKANLTQREPQMLKHWQQMDLYEKIRLARKGCHKFILHDGPPYANGALHMGHALNKTLKDIVIKAKTLAGFDAPYVPGWDCHGLPIELNVEKKTGKPSVKLSAQAFRKECRKYAGKQINIQRKAFIRLGILGDWPKPYMTLDYRFEANVVRAFGQILSKGHVHKGLKPVHWCVDCESSLAEAEVEYQDKTSPSIDVRFKVLDARKWLECFDLDPLPADSALSVLIWTTTPWTLPANEAVCLHPELTYVLLECESKQGKEFLVVAESLVEAIANRGGLTQLNIKARAKGAVFDRLILRHPFYDKQVPIILGQHVTDDAGTGAVHTAPGHGPDDFIIGKKYGLPTTNPVDGDGRYYQDTPLFAGIMVHQANAPVIEVLKQQGNLLAFDDIQHSYPHCWRHKTAVIFRAAPQWFISMDKQGLLDNAIKAVDTVTWLPEWGRSRFESMLAKRPDWCLSRQRTWGSPLVIITHKQSGEIHPEMPSLLEQVAAKIEQQGMDAWYEMDLAQLLGDEAQHYEKASDSLDVWFDSGVTHACVLDEHDQLHSPADLYLEGSDQHRGWFQSSMLSAIAMKGRAPYKTVLTHGFVVDADGKKMSKSLGNVIEPDEIIRSLGADVLRLWAASADYRGEMTVSRQILARSADTYRRIRNTARFLLGNLHGFDPSKDLLPNNELLALDQWAIDRAYSLQQAIVNDYDNYQFSGVFRNIHHFCSIDMGSFYLDVIKDRQYTTGLTSKARRSAQTALYHIVEALVRWIAPILSFTADELWACMPGERAESVFLSTWYDQLQPLSDSNALNHDFWVFIEQFRSVVNRELEQQRINGVIGGSLDAELTIYGNEACLNHLQQLGDELRFLLITSDAHLKPLQQKPADAVETEMAGIWLKVQASAHTKCARCWHHRADVGAVVEHPLICSRCVENVSGQGEQRCYA